MSSPQPEQANQKSASHSATIDEISSNIHDYAMSRASLPAAKAAVHTRESDAPRSTKTGKICLHNPNEPIRQHQAKRSSLIGLL